MITRRACLAGGACLLASGGHAWPAARTDERAKLRDAVVSAIRRRWPKAEISLTADPSEIRMGRRSLFLDQLAQRIRAAAPADREGVIETYVQSLDFQWKQGDPYEEVRSLQALANLNRRSSRLKLATSADEAGGEGSRSSPAVTATMR
jgi:hypothetical protein